MRTVEFCKRAAGVTGGRNKHNSMVLEVAENGSTHR